MLKSATATFLKHPFWQIWMASIVRDVAAVSASRRSGRPGPRVDLSTSLQMNGEGVAFSYSTRPSICALP